MITNGMRQCATGDDNLRQLFMNLIRLKTVEADEPEVTLKRKVQ